MRRQTPKLPLLGKKEQIRKALTLSFTTQKRTTMTPPQPKWKSETAEEETGEGQQPRFTMGYWQMRGLGAAIRMLLHWGKCTHGGAEMNFKDVQYAQDADGVNEWFKRDKVEMIKDANPLANIPYLIDHEEKKTIVQFLCICDYLGRKIGVDETDENSDQRLRNAQIAMEIFDLRNSVIRLVYKFPNSVRTQSEFYERLPEHLGACKKTYEKLESWLQFHDFTYFAKKDAVSSCDFHAFEMIDQHEHYQTLVRGKDGEAVEKQDMLSEFPRLKKFHAEMKSRPELKAYFESKEYKEFQLNNHTLANSWDGPGPSSKR